MFSCVFVVYVVIWVIIKSSFNNRLVIYVGKLLNCI